MIHEPPVDKMVEIVGNRYVLCCLAAKRARQIIDQPMNFTSDVLEKPISQSAKEIYEGKLTYINE